MPISEKDFEEATRLLETSLWELREHNAEYNHRTREGHLRAVEAFLRKHRPAAALHRLAGDATD